MKKLSVLTLLFLAILVKLHGQESQVSIGLIGSIEGNKYDFKSTNLNTNYDYKSQIGYSYGLRIKYSLKGNLFFESGLTYYSQGYQVKYNYVFMDEGDPLIPRQSDLSLSYLKVPLKVGFRVYSLGDLNFNPSFGLNTSFQINSNEMTIYEDNAERKSSFLSDKLNQTQFALNLDLGFEYNVTENLILSIVPFVSKGLNKLDDEAMNSGQFSYGGFFGIFYKL